RSRRPRSHRLPVPTHLCGRSQGTGLLHLISIGGTHFAEVHHRTMKSSTKQLPAAFTPLLDMGTFSPKHRRTTMSGQPTSIVVILVKNTLCDVVDKRGKAFWVVPGVPNASWEQRIAREDNGRLVAVGYIDQGN